MTLEFFFDLSSPYSYLAATQVPALAGRAGVDVAWKPFVLGAVFEATRNKPPVISSEKTRWTLQDLHRWAAAYGVPFQMTTRFPVNAIRAMRLIVAVDAAGGGKAVDATLAAFRALWVDDRDITSDAELRAIASAIGADPDAVLAAIETPAIKDRLRAHGDDAVARGAFGAPSFFVGDELYWGDDRLHQVEAALARDRLPPGAP